MRQICYATAAALCAFAALTSPTYSRPSPLSAGREPFCRLYFDPHDKFTRVVAPSSGRAALRANATLSNINVTYTGFTAEALTAFRAGLDIWRTQISSSVPIVMEAEFTDLGNPNLLGDARFRTLSYNFTGAPFAWVLFPGPIANRLSGADLDGASSEVVVRLNSGANWNFATDGVPVAGKADFVSAVLHEIGHGFGHCGSAEISSAGLGSWGYQGLPYVYDVGVVDNAGVFMLNQNSYPNGSTALASLLRGTGLSGSGIFWAGAQGVSANGGVRPRLYSPPTYLPGSSFNHLDETAFPPGDLNSLMTPSLAAAEVIHTPGAVLNGMFADMGWGSRCSFGLSRTLAQIGAAGGSVSVTLSTTAGCAWTASTTSGFASIAAGHNGNASAVVQVAVTPNTSADARIATVHIADQTLTVAQDGTTPCAFALNPASASMGAAGGAGSIALQTAAACAWSATANPSQAQITSASSGVGEATIGYSVLANPVSAPRTVTLTVGGQPFVVTQAPVPPTMTLDKTALRFGAITTGAGFNSVTSAQAVRLTKAGSGTVTWTATTSSPWLAVSPASGSGSATLAITAQFTSSLAAEQTGTVTLTYTGASNATGTISVSLATLSPAQSSGPFGGFDTPGEGSTGVFGSIPVTGWALDDVEVTRVRIMRDPVDGEAAGALVYIGDAVLVDGARPDVQALYPALPRNTRGGWGYLMLTNFLPSLGNGTFRLTAIADDADGHSTVLGTKTITCTNATATAPFGAIDTPDQGGTATGNLLNFGWVLGPAPRRADPPGGGTVQIVVDGAFLAAVPGGWTSRADLAALFPAPQYPGIDTALGVATLDTTTLTNGVHTIAWVVTDDHGTASGIGSRYFTVSNDTAPALRSNVEAPSTAHAALTREHAALVWRSGYDQSAPYQTLVAGADGRFVIHSEEIDRLEVRLGPGATGYQRVAGAQAPLPAGSRIDPATGTFTWQPGVGFVGAYDFVLAGRDVRIVLHPKARIRSGPQVVIDIPGANAREAAPFVVAGWAVDLDSSIGTGIDTVHVWAYPAGPGASRMPIFIGAAAYGGARPDVAAVFGERFGRSGYGIDVRDLPQGAYDIAVFAYSTVTDEFVSAKTVHVVVR